jgi:hypothetical protein
LPENRACEPCALHVEIPGRELELAFLPGGVNGTLSDRGELLDGVAERLGALRGKLEPPLLSADTFQTLCLQLVLGDDRAEVSLDNLERLEDRPLCQQLAVVLRALTVVAATRVLGWKVTDGIPTPTPGCCGIEVDRGGQLVVAAVARVAKAVELSVRRLDEPEPRVPQRVSPVQGLEQRRVDLTSAV